MKLQNLKVKVKTVGNEVVELETDQGFTITVPKHLLSAVSVGEELFIAADAKPLVSSEQHAKDVLNEMIKE